MGIWSSKLVHIHLFPSKIAMEIMGKNATNSSRVKHIGLHHGLIEFLNTFHM
jgi:hypothetical protein